MFGAILGQMNQVHTLPSHVFMIHCNIIFTSTPRSSKWSPFLQIFLSKLSMHFSFLRCVLHVPTTSTSFTWSSPILTHKHEYLIGCTYHYLSRCQPCLSQCCHAPWCNNLELSVPVYTLDFVVSSESSVPHGQCQAARTLT
jgi:hypothetical protein